MKKEMDESAATLLSGLGSGVIAGSIGVFSAVLSYWMAQKQADRDVRERERDRKHQVEQLAIPRRLEAAEVAWRLLFKLEQTSKLTVDDVDALITAQMWFPSDVRASCLALLKKWQSTSESGTGGPTPQDIAACRQGLLRLTGLEVAKE